MVSAVGVISLEFCVLALVCLFLLREYASRVVSVDVCGTVFLSWLFGFAGILLLPYDISTVGSTNPSSTTSSVLQTWKIIYWITFVLAWLVLPLQHDYHRSGHFTRSSKLADAVRTNLYFYLGVFACGVVFVVYVLSTSSWASSVSQVVGFLMACGNTYGVLLLCVFMGNGLVGLPIRLWQLCDDETELHRLYLQAEFSENRYHETRFALEDIEGEVASFVREVRNTATLDAGAGSSLLRNAETLEAVATNFSYPADRAAHTSRISSSSSSSSTTASNSSATLSNCVQLHKQLKCSQTVALVSLQRWQMLCKRSKQLEERMLKQMPLGPGPGLGLGPTSTQSTTSTTTSITTTTIATTLRVHCAQYGLKLLSACCFVLSAILIWSELVMASQLHSPIGLMLGLYHHPTPPSTTSPPVLIQTLSFLILAYMSICAYWSLFRLNVFGLEYTIQRPKLSCPAALLLNAEYFCRMQFSLGYNFLLILNAHQVVDQTAFRQLMTNMEIIPLLGTSFTVYVPIVMVGVSFATICNGYGYCLKFLGIEPEESMASSSLAACLYGAAAQLDQDDEVRLATGKKLVTAELRRAAFVAPTPSSVTASPLFSTSNSRISIEMPSRGQRLVPGPGPGPGVGTVTSHAGGIKFVSGYSDLNNTEHEDDDDDDDAGKEVEVVVHERKKDLRPRNRLESWGLGDQEDDEEGSPMGRY